MPTYDVTFPDGYVQTFQGPATLSDDDARIRAVQERSIAEGRIPTTWWKGAGKHLGEDPATTGALITAGGMGAQVAGAALAPVTAGASLGLIPAGQAMMAAAPLGAHLTQYATQAATGQNPDAPSPVSLVRDAAVGAAGAYGPQVAGKAAGLVAEHLPTAGIGGFLAKLTGAAPVTQMVDAGAEPIGNVLSGQTAKTTIDRLRQLATEARTGITAREVERVSSHIADGMNPQAALRLVAGNDKSKLPALTSAWIRARLASAAGRAAVRP